MTKQAPFIGSVPPVTGFTAIKSLLDTLKVVVDAILTDTSITLESKLDALTLICTATRLAELDAANIPADIDTLKISRLAFAGTVSGIVGAPNFQCSDLIGLGNDYFEDYWAYVVWDAAGTGGAPQSERLVCTGYDSATGDFTVAAFTVPIAVGDKVLLIHPSLTLKLPYGNRVYWDETLGVSGTDWPIGTATHPSNSLADLRTICARENIYTIVVRGYLVLDANMDNYNFIGSDFNYAAGILDEFDLNGKSIDNCTFERLHIWGIQGGGACILYHCYANPLFSFNGIAIDCIIGIIQSPLSNCQFIRCISHRNAARLDMGGSAVSIYLYDWIGKLSIQNLDVAGTVYIYALASSDITPEANCTAGEIYLYGDYILTDNSGVGCVVYNLGNITLIKTQTDKLTGATPVSSSTTANWNTTTGTSGEAGEDLVTIGANGVKNKVLSLVVDISALTVGSAVTIKMFQKVNGIEKKIYSEGFVRQAQVQGSEPDGLWVIAGVVGIHESLRVEVYSSTDESVAIAYDYMLETM